ncbi:MAG: TrbI/VirB10 family protein [Rhizobiaceae bacterium]
MADNADKTQKTYAEEVEGLNPVDKKQPNWKLIIGAGLVVGAIAFSEAYRFYQDYNPSPEEQQIEKSDADEYQGNTASRIIVPAPKALPIVFPEPIIVEKIVNVEDQAAIDALKKELEALKNSKLTPEELQKLIADQVAVETAKLNKKHEDELFALEQARIAREAKLAASAETARLEAEHRRLLEEKRASAAALFDKQVHSKMLVGESKGGSGAIGVAQGILPPAQNGQEYELSANEAFLKDSTKRKYEAVVAQKIPFMSNTIVEGTFIHAALETAIDSSLPGSIRAVVIMDVYSMDGRAVLMPKGTRLIGTYSSITSLAQKRTLVVWTRAITPDGLSFEMAAAGSDSLGRSGLTGKVDTHFFARFGSAALISVVAAIPTILASETGASSTTTDTLQNVGGDFSSAFSETVSDYLKIAPTIKIKQGGEITVITSQNIVIFG